MEPKVMTAFLRSLFSEMFSGLDTVKKVERQERPWQRRTFAPCGILFPTRQLARKAIRRAKKTAAASDKRRLRLARRARMLDAKKARREAAA